jgi:hypothetical protein
MKHLLMWVLVIQATAAGQLRITVYDKANLTEAVRANTLEDLRRIFRQSKVDFEFVAGDINAEEASVMIYPQRMRPGTKLESICAARRDIALDIVAFAPYGLDSRVLGLAQPFTPTGLNVRIFNDRIQTAAARESRAYATVMAHAIAHEIGHVLLRSNQHTHWGLMSNAWTSREYDWMETGGLLFTDEQSRSMLANLRGDGCADVRSKITAGNRP